MTGPCLERGLERGPGAGRVAGRQQQVAEGGVVERERVALEPLVGGRRDATPGPRATAVAGSPVTNARRAARMRAADPSAASVSAA